jgi:hypothetical protein
MYRTGKPCILASCSGVLEVTVDRKGCIALRSNGFQDSVHEPVLKNLENTSFQTGSCIYFAQEQGSPGFGQPLLKSKSKSHYDQQSVSQFVLVSFPCWSR